jgi:hypothetical protein
VPNQYKQTRTDPAISDTTMEQFQHLLPAQNNSLIHNIAVDSKGAGRWHAANERVFFSSYRRRMCSFLLSSDCGVHIYMYDHLNSGLIHRRQSRTNSNTTFVEPYVCNITTLLHHPQLPDWLWGTPRRRRVKLAAISILGYSTHPRTLFLKCTFIIYLTSITVSRKSYPPFRDSE